MNSDNFVFRNHTQVKDASGVNYFSTTNPGNVTIQDANITIPMDYQGVLKTEVIYTATALGGNASYTSSWIPVATVKRLLILLTADQSGNLYIEHSRDGSNARRTRTITYTASTPQALEEPCYSQYIRLVYTNGASAQTNFELSAMTSAD